MNGGNRKIYLVKESFDQYQEEAFQDSIRKIIEKEHEKFLLIFPATFTGNDLAARISVLFSTTIITDCTDVYFQEEKQDYIFVRPNHEKQKYQHFIQKNNLSIIVTLKEIPCTLEKIAECIELKNYGFSIQGISVYGSIKNKKEESEITSAGCLVAGGNGIRKKEDFALLEKFAKAINGQICVSRPVVDKGWFPKDVQVGLSGFTVKPKIYFAIGISGAFQHTVGIGKADIIVAINMDRNAMIFDIADFGIVADYKDTLRKILIRINRKDKR